MRQAVSPTRAPSARWGRQAWLLLIGVLLVASGCGTPSSSVRAATPSSGPASADQFVDVHFHVSNYAYQGVSLKTLVDRYMGNRIIRSVIMPLPLQQKWDAFEHYAQDRLAPTYYLGPKAELYYYAFADAMIAREYGRLSPADRARLDPMITGFNPMDLYAVQHIKRVLLTFPGVFSGIGEFTVHKELVSNKIAGDPIEDHHNAGCAARCRPGRQALPSESGAGGGARSGGGDRDGRHTPQRRLRDGRPI